MFGFSLQQFFILDQSAIDEIRKATICWWQMEEGAPAIHPASPMIDIDQADYGKLLYAFIQASNLKLGVRRFENPLIGLAPYNRHSHGVPSMYFDGDEMKKEIEIDVTEAHLKLLRAMSLEHEHPKHLPRFEPKRVYNGFLDAAVGAYMVINDVNSDEDEEIAEGLQLEELKPYEKLHLETTAALQVLVREAAVEPGFYQDRLLHGFEYLRDLSDYDIYKSRMQKTGLPASRQGYIDAVLQHAGRK